MFLYLMNYDDFFVLFFIFFQTNHVANVLTNQLCTNQRQLKPEFSVKLFGLPLYIYTRYMSLSFFSKIRKFSKREIHVVICNK